MTKHIMRTLHLPEDLSELDADDFYAINDAVIKARAACDAEWGRRLRVARTELDKRLHRVVIEHNPGDVFRLDELVFAASARCRVCGHGLAYGGTDRGVLWTQWYCSGLLTGESIYDGETVHDALPFAFWKVTSETSPQAHGRTTRPEQVDDDKAH